MTLWLHRADRFKADFEQQFRWFEERGGPELGDRFLSTVVTTLELLSRHPGIGVRRNFPQFQLEGLHSFALSRPFNRLLIFYRFDPSTLRAIRLMHGARDLPRRLMEEGTSGDFE